MTTNITEKQDTPEKTELTCGIIMPIASHPEYPTGHWSDVLEILNEAVGKTDFQPKLVSEDLAVGLIHDRIVTNIYYNEIVICDVSSKNPNVMFELGLRLAFNKPTIIIKDDITGYSFDTSVIEHIPYPSSLRFSQIVKFKEELIRRIDATYQRSKNEPNYSPFLGSFGKTIVPATLNQTKIPEGEYIMNQLNNLSKQIQIMRFEQRTEITIKQRDFSMFSELDRNKIIYSFMNYFRNNYSYKELLEDSKLSSQLRNELAEKGVKISESELKEFIMKFYLDRL